MDGFRVKVQTKNDDVATVGSGAGFAGRDEVLPGTNITDFQMPLRGGLHWFDMQMMKLHGTVFLDSKPEHQISDAIAYPSRAKPAMKLGAAFYTSMRNLTAKSFYSSEMDIKDIGYKEHSTTRWNGVRDDVRKQHGLAYSEKAWNECVKIF
jgi:hypothetical protein